MTHTWHTHTHTYIHIYVCHNNLISWMSSGKDCKRFWFMLSFVSDVARWLSVKNHMSVKTITQLHERRGYVAVPPSYVNQEHHMPAKNITLQRNTCPSTTAGRASACTDSCWGLAPSGSSAPAWERVFVRACVSKWCASVRALWMDVNINMWDGQTVLHSDRCHVSYRGLPQHLFMLDTIHIYIRRRAHQFQRRPV